jgi:phosphopantetheinyl transferase (holo-ACP synthase)
MVGNDVVDLLDPESDPSTLSPRFDQRVFTAAEREDIARSKDSRSERWCRWAAKEAVFKLARKLDPRVIFSPVRFEVKLSEAASGTNEREGRVIHGGAEHSIRLWCDHDSVHALSASPLTAESPLLHGVLRLPADDPELTSPEGPGGLLQRLAVREIAGALGISPAALEIRKHRRIPTVYLGGRPADVDLSLSHHGALVAWAFRVGRAHTQKRLAS